MTRTQLLNITHFTAGLILDVSETPMTDEELIGKLRSVWRIEIDEKTLRVALLGPDSRGFRYTQGKGWDRPGRMRGLFEEMPI